MELFEQVLQEASKRRFIEPLWKTLISCEYQDDFMRGVSENKTGSDLPSAEEIIKWVDSGAADKYKLDWNILSKHENLWKDDIKSEILHLLKSYFDYLINKESKKDPKAQFNDKEQFKILREDDDWLLVGVLNYEGALYCDSFKCGGAGAKWCIGYEKSDYYWKNYTENKNSVFILAYNKKIYGDKDNQKFMIELDGYLEPGRPAHKTDATTWQQDDDPNETLNNYQTLKKFDLTDEQLLEWYNELRPVVMKISYAQTFSLSQLEHNIVNVATKSSSLYLLPEEQKVSISIYRVYDNLKCSADTNLSELVYDGDHLDKKEVIFGQFRMAPSWKRQTQTQYKCKPHICFMNMDLVHIDRLWVSLDWPLITFHNCKKVEIDSVAMPEPYQDEDFEKWFEQKDFKQIIKEEELAVDFSKCDDVVIKGIVILPNSTYSSMDPDVYHSNDSRKHIVKFIPYDTFDHGQKEIIDDWYKSVRINMFAEEGFSTWETKWKNYINTDTKEIYVDKMIIPLSKEPLSLVKLYNTRPGYKLIWRKEYGKGPEPKKIKAIPYYEYEKPLIESTIFDKTMTLHESYDDEDEEIKGIILKLWPQFAKKAGIDERIQSLPIKFEDINTLELNAAATTDMELVDKDLKLGITIDPVIFCFKTERLIGVLIHEMAHAEIVYKLYDKYVNGEIDFGTLKEGCKQNQKHFEPWKKAATYISRKNNLNPDYATITEIDFEDDSIYEDSEPLQEGKDYKYRAKVGNLWLQGCGKETDLTADPEEATDYESKTEPTQIFNQMKKDKRVKKNEKLDFQKIEESLKLQEADKSRFLKPLWDQFSANSEPVKQFNITYEDLLNFINKDDPLIKKYFDIYGINWQSAGSDGSRWVSITQAYLERLKIQKNKEREKAVWGKDNIIDMATAVGLRVCEQGTEVDDSYDFVHLADLDNEKFTFMAPMTYDACVFCDSVQAGGEGAKWCLGYEKTNDYWNDYTEEGNLFIFAFNNKAFKEGKSRESDTLKYMIQLNENAASTQGWLQSDDPDETIWIRKFKRVFGRSAVEMAVSFANSILCDDNIYSRNQSYGFWSVEDSEAQIPWEDDELLDIEFYLEDFYNGVYDIDIEDKEKAEKIKRLICEKGHDVFRIICEGKDFEPSKMHIHELNDCKDFDIPKFCDWLKRCGLNKVNTYIHIEDTSIESVIWEPEASNNTMTIVFNDCKINDLYSYDFSDGDQQLFVEGDESAVHRIHWPVPENMWSSSENYVKDLRIDLDAYSIEDVYEEEEEFED